MKKKIFVCSPLRGDFERMRQTKKDWEGTRKQKLWR